MSFSVKSEQFPTGSSESPSLRIALLSHWHCTERMHQNASRQMLAVAPAGSQQVTMNSRQSQSTCLAPPPALQPICPDAPSLLRPARPHTKSVGPRRAWPWTAVAGTGAACRSAPCLNPRASLDLGLEVDDLLPGEVGGRLAPEVAIGGRRLVARAVEVQVARDHS